MDVTATLTMIKIVKMDFLAVVRITDIRIAKETSDIERSDSITTGTVVAEVVVELDLDLIRNDARARACPSLHWRNETLVDQS